MEHIKKLKKLKAQKLFKSKKFLKNENLFKFATKKIGSSFLASNTRITFNYLRLTFIKTLIFNILI